VNRENFDGDGAIEASVAGAIDLSHAAGADRGLNLVRSEPAPRNEWHEFGVLYIGALHFRAAETRGVAILPGYRNTQRLLALGRLGGNQVVQGSPEEACKMDPIPIIILLIADISAFWYDVPAVKT
jgi:hypothetical protein